ncbi:redoxin family protein [candidate division KSB1 bacterium]
MPFHTDVSEDGSGHLNGVVRNGEERLPFSSVKLKGDSIYFVFEHYDSILRGTVSGDRKNISGIWTRRSMGDQRTTMKFSAKKDNPARFELIDESYMPQGIMENISGEWITYFGEDPENHSQAIFEQDDNGIVTGTFLTDVGDFRYLEGTYEKGVLRLSVFDGAHAFLFAGAVDSDGKMTGKFFSRNSAGIDWTATRGSKAMPDPYTLTKLTNNERKFRFSFPDVDGNIVSNEDERFSGKASLVYIFGTWCPNCNDEVQLLVELNKKYHDRGLEIVGLANEFSDDFEKDSEIVKTYMKKYSVTWPMLVVGVANKRRTQELLPDLDRVLSYPTTVFIDRQGKVFKIHTGFTGPGTGEHHIKLVEEFNKNIEAILK